MHAKEWEQKHPDQAKAMDGNSSNSEQAKAFDDQFPQGTAMARKGSFSSREYPIVLRGPSLSHDRQFQESRAGTRRRQVQTE
jgi:hypothetical protein